MSLQHERDRLVIDNLQGQLDLAHFTIRDQSARLVACHNKKHDAEHYAAELQTDLEEADRRISALTDRVVAAERLSHELQRKIAEMSK